MNWFQKRKVGSLAEWLAIATDRVAAAGRERIRSEIEAHYAEAVTARLARGETELVAQTGALADLGDARQAGRRFRRKHLTVKQEDYLIKLRGSLASPLSRVKLQFIASTLIAAFFVVISINSTFDRNGHLFFCVIGTSCFAAMAAAFAILYVSRLLIRTLPLLSAVNWLVVIQLLPLSIFALLITGCFFWQTTKLMLILGTNWIFAVNIFFRQMLFWLRIRAKVRNEDMENRRTQET